MVNLRQAQSGDHLLMSAVIKSNSKLYDDIMPGAFTKYAEKLLSQGMPNYEVEIIRDNQKSIGFIGYELLDDQTLYLVALYIDSDYHGLGIGSNAMNLLMNKLSDEVKRICLLVHQEAHWAQSFYSKYGFEFYSNEAADIKSYRGGLLADYYLSNTILLEYRMEHK